MGLDSQGHEILKSKIALTLQHQILSGKCPSHIIPGLSKSKQYTGVHIQASVLSILCHDIHWPWRNTDLCDTAEHYSTMFIFMYDHPLWWKSIIIIKNKPETSNLHGIVLRLGGFHTLISLLEVVDHIMAGWSLWSLLALRLKHSDWNLRRQCFLHRVVKGHLLEDDGLNKTIAAKMLGMFPPVACWGLGSWW